MAPGDRPLPSQSLSRRFYSVLTWLVQPLLRRKLRRRGQAEPGYLMRIDAVSYTHLTLPTKA